jgi:CBS domain-containing protein
MADRLSATPLLALDAVVFDTETTSLDPARARVVEIGAVRIQGGRVDEAARFRTLVDPGVPIPPAASGIHGIDAPRLKGAPDFAAAWKDFQKFLGQAAVVGHTIDYDLAVLTGECRRAGLPFQLPRFIDVRILAEIVEPNLSGFSLEELAGWLEVPMEHRHSALGDAITTARIFVALVPRLREGGIRTFAEAEANCRELSEAVAIHHRAGWIDPTLSPARVDAERTFARLDSYPYRHRIRDVMSAPALFVDASATLGDALQLLMKERVSSVFMVPGVHGQDRPPALAECGIITERDILRAIASDGAAALTKTVGSVASRPLVAVPADAFIYLALGRMSRMQIRHLAVIDELDRVVGALSARDLLRLRAGDAIVLGDEISEAPDPHALAVSWAKLPVIARGLVAESVDVRTVAAVISRELGSLTRRAALLAEGRMRAAGRGEPPVPYAVLVLGSAGRGESLLAMDQDNAVIFAEGKPDGPEDRWFAELGNHIADILHEVGVPYCKGGVMAKNAAFRGSAKTWRDRIGQWVLRSNPQDLLSVDIFFDFRAVHGDGALAAALWQDAYDRVEGEIGFLKLLAEAAGPFDPPLGFFGIKTENGRVDLKRGGLFGIVAAARILALRFHVAERSTRERLEGVKALKIGAEHDLAALLEAHYVLLANILRQQLVDIAAGRPPSNKVETRRLDRAELDRLKAALRSLKYADQVIRDLLTTKS